MAVKRVVAGLVAFGALAGAALAQTAPGGAGGVRTPADAREQQQAQARYKVFVMEGVLERAAQNGAAVFTRQVRAISPDAMFLSGAARVRGFRLDAYGLFFDVEVPALRPTVAWTLRAMIDDNGESLAQLKSFVRKVQDPHDRAELERAIRNLELQMPGARPAASADAVSAQAVAAGNARTVAPQPPPSTDPLLLTNPAAAFTREVKGALIDAMIENSGPLGIAPEEWLTIAARDSEAGNRLVPGDAYDVTTTVLRVKGSDLADYRAGRLTLEEARAKVEIKEF